MNDEIVYITKASGEREPFYEAKLRRSLERARAAPDLIDSIVSRIKGELHDGMTTSEIYRRAFSLLRRRRRSMAARYSLKKAIMELGPTGHPFEKLVGEILKSQGYSVEVGRMVRGACVEHEVDVVALKGKRRVMVECKFHNEAGVKSDIKVALYVRARFEDIEKAWQAQAKRGEHFDEAWLVTNTKLTTDAIEYARCVGMKAIGWSHPQGSSLSELIDRAGLQPVTSLTGLSRNQKVQLLNEGIILCRELLEHPEALEGMGITETGRDKIFEETGELCRNGENI
jgi:Holliday junction resolvase-like predicted endonuclease